MMMTLMRTNFDYDVSVIFAVRRRSMGLTWDRNFNGDAPRISTNYDEDDADDVCPSHARKSSGNGY